MEKLNITQQVITDLERQAIDIRARLVSEWDIDAHIELATWLFVFENRVASAITQVSPLRA